MAVFNEILVGRFARSVQKLFGVKASPPVNALSSDVMCTHAYATGVENRYLEGWSRHSVRVLLVASAGNINSLKFRNPVGSNVIAVFESFIVGNESALPDQVVIIAGPGTVDFGATFTLAQTRWDARGQQNPTLIVSSALNGGLPGTIRVEKAFQANVSAEFILTDDQEWPLLPGENLQANQITVNQQIIVSATWRERFLEDSERT